MSLQLAFLLYVVAVFSQDGLTGSAWGDWANYTASPLRAFENELGQTTFAGWRVPTAVWSPGAERRRLRFAASVV